MVIETLYVKDCVELTLCVIQWCYLDENVLSILKFVLPALGGIHIYHEMLTWKESEP